MKKISYLFILIVHFLLSCESEEFVPKVTSFRATSSIAQLGFLGEDSAEPVMVQVFSQDALPMKGVEVHFEVVMGNADLQYTSMITDANGIAFTFVHFTEALSNLAVIASVEELSEPIPFFFQVSTGRASTMQLISGDNQEGPMGTPLKDKFVIKVSDDFGNVAAGFPVKFYIREGNGKLSQQVVQTDATGLATTNFTLGTGTILNKIVAKIELDSVIFTGTSLFPTTLQSISKTTEFIELKWNKNINSNFKNYVILRAESTSPTFVQTIKTIDDPNTTEFHDVTVNVGYSYFYQVAIETTTGWVLKSDTKQLEFGEIMTLSGIPVDMEIDEPRGRIYVSVRSANEIQVIDIASRQLVDKIWIGSGPQHIALSKDNSTLYVALGGSGEVAMLNLDTKEKVTVDVKSALGYSFCWDVIEGAPNRVFATANAGSGGLSYLAVIKLDQDNATARFNTEILRDDPTLDAEYGKYVYSNNGARLFKFDLSASNGGWIQAKTFSSPRPNKLVNHDGSRIYLEGGESVNTSNFAIVNDYGVGLPALDSDETHIHYLFSNTLQTFNTTTFVRTRQIYIEPKDELKFKISGDNSMFYILSKIPYNSSSYRIYFVENK